MKPGRTRGAAPSAPAPPAPREPFPLAGTRNGIFYDLLTGEGVWEAFTGGPKPLAPTDEQKD